MTTIAADLGDDNVYDLDATIALDAVNDKIWFTAKRWFEDLDTAAIVRCGTTNVGGGLSGITVTDAANGKFKVVVPKTQLPDSLTDEALIYDCQLKLNATGQVVTVCGGSMRLRKRVTKAQ